MNEEESKHWISVGMSAAYSDMGSRLQHKVDTLYLAIDKYPEHQKFYEDLIDIVNMDLEYVKSMLTVANRINRPTLQ